MSIISHGIDLVDFPRIESMIERHGARFLNRVFTEREQSDAEAVHNRIEKLAGRFAGKEAVMKLLGTGWRGKIAWTDIEIVNSSMGQPVVEISGEVRRIAEASGIGRITMSITHTANFAIASVVALADET